MIEEKKIENIIQDNMMNYSAYVLLDRALPDFRDGLKPVHRRILFTMHMMKAYKFTKSANCSGQVMKLHPHGDTYPTMVGMVQKDRQLVPLLEGKGNFAMHTSRDMAPAANRYSEIKLSEFAIDMMKNFEKGVVDFVDNYDGTIRMPEVIPVKYPSLLSQAQSGIGVGFASSIPSFNLVEICDATEKFIRTKEHTLLIPDFATGGKILNEPEVFEQINKVGQATIGRNASVRLRAKTEIVGNEILITEMPYSTTREAFIEKVIELVKSSKLKEISDIQDLTGLKGLLISITARKGTDMQLLLQKLYQSTPLQSTYSCNMNMLVNNLPRVLGTEQVIETWIEWRRNSIARGLAYDINQMTEKLHILRGLEKVMLDIDKAIDIIRKSKESEIELNLSKHFILDNEQSIEVANMRLRNINKEYILKKIKDIDKFEKEIKSMKKTLDDPKKLDELIIEGLKETREKYGTPRRTELIDRENNYTIPRIIEEVPSYPVVLYLTKEGYCYKFKSYQNPFLKPGDEVLKIFETTNNSEIVVFTEDVLCYKIDVSKIDETRITSLGTYLPSMVRANFEVVSYTVCDKKNKMVLVFYTNGKVAKIDMKVYGGNRTLLKYGYSANQKVLDIITLQDEAKLKIITDLNEVNLDTTTLKLQANRTIAGTLLTKHKIKEIRIN